MHDKGKGFSRKKFLAWGVGITSLLAIPAFLRSSKKGATSKTVKMLSQDGQLVEIEEANVPVSTNKIKDADIHSWVNRKPKTL